MKITKILILTISLTMAGMPAFAQRQIADERPRDAGGVSPDPGQGGPPSEERREEVRKKIEAVRIWRLTEELKLDTTASAKLSSFLSSLDQKRRDTMRDQMEAMRDLRSLLKTAKPDEAKIKSLLEKLEKNHHEIQGLKDQEMKGLKDILTIEQQARFLIFQQEFQREMRSMISGVRGKGRGKGGMGLGGPIPGGPEEDQQPNPPRRGQ